MKSLLTAMLCLCALTSAAQTSSPKAPDWSGQWQAAAQQLIGVAEAMPADKYGYKPVKEARAFGEQVVHAVLVMKIVLASVKGEKLDMKKVAADLDMLKTKDQILPELRRTVDSGAAAFKKITGGNVGQIVESLMQVVAHNNNHYGQLVVYLRLNGITPPASRS